MTSSGRLLGLLASLTKEGTIVVEKVDEQEGLTPADFSVVTTEKGHAVFGADNMPPPQNQKSGITGSPPYEMHPSQHPKSCKPEPSHPLFAFMQTTFNTIPRESNKQVLVDFVPLAC